MVLRRGWVSVALGSAMILLSIRCASLPPIFPPSPRHPQLSCLISYSRAAHNRQFERVSVIGEPDSDHWTVRYLDRSGVPEAAVLKTAVASRVQCPQGLFLSASPAYFGDDQRRGQ